MILNKRFVVLLNVVHFEIKQYLAESGFDITPEQFLLLDSLWDKTEGVSQQEAADLIMKDKNSITRIVDSLERKGYIRRMKEKGDRRVNKLYLTPKAMEISQRIQETAEKAIQNAVEGISEQELENVVDALLKIHGNVSALRDGKGHRISLE